MKTPVNARTPVAHPYARISHPDQRKGGGLERQTEAQLGTFCQLFGFVQSKKLWVDDGVSAWKGLNATPEHQLGQFLADARQGLIPPGDCLLLENWDRLTRQDIWASMGLVNDLRQLGIHVGRLDRMKLLRSDSTDAGDFFEAALEMMRGNSESVMKSFRNRAKHVKNRAQALATGKLLTKRLPSWIELKDGVRVLIPERAAVIKRIFQLAANGHGAGLIVKRLTEDKVPTFGAYTLVTKEDGDLDLTRKGRPKRKAVGGYLGAGHWTRNYINLILTDCRVLGHLQPKLSDGTPDGPIITNYFPAVVTQTEFDLASAGRSVRRPVRDPAVKIGKHVELFAGLIKDAYDGGSYFTTSRREGGRQYRVLLNTNSAEGRAKCRSFPMPAFERAILCCLREIDPREILTDNQDPDETLVLAGQLARVESELAEATAFMDTEGFSPTIGKRITALEARKREVVEKLSTARQIAAHPLRESWGEAQTLLSTLDTAPDKLEARVKLRAVIRRVVESMWIAVVPRGRSRLCEVQMYFTAGKRRDYMILYTPTKANGKGTTPPGTWVTTLTGHDSHGLNNYDLRESPDDQCAISALEELPLDVLFPPGCEGGLPSDL